MSCCTAHEAPPAGGRTIVERFDIAAGNFVSALAAAGGQPEHLVYVTIYVTDVAEYGASLGELGGVYRCHFGHHYPAMALLGVGALFDDAAKIEVVGVAVIPSLPARASVSVGRAGRSGSRTARGRMPVSLAARLGPLSPSVAGIDDLSIALADDTSKS
jgi:hypothetical protein